jgi:hypothetical protein
MRQLYKLGRKPGRRASDAAIHLVEQTMKKLNAVESCTEGCLAWEEFYNAMPEGHVKDKLQLWQLAKDFFMDNLPLLRRELPPVPRVPSFSLSALRAAAVVPFGESWLLQLQIPAAGGPA